MWFYGAIEQLLSGWVFELIPGGEADFDRAREMVVETICGGLEAHGSATGRRARRRQPMWESLATTRRQDRVLHGAAKLLNVVVGVVAAARSGCWASGSATPCAACSPRLDAEPGAAAGRAAARALDGRPDGGPRGDPAASSATPRPRWLRKGLADISTLRARPAPRGRQPRLRLSRPVLGPRASRARTASTSRRRVGAPRGSRAGPGLIVVHGLFSSRRFDYVRQIAVRAYYEWGFNVLALDLRSFGLTNLTSQAPTTVGWKEGEDVVAAGRYLKQLGATTVGALGISLGGSSVLGACHAAGRRRGPRRRHPRRSRPPADVRAMASGCRGAFRSLTPRTRSTAASGRCSTSRIREAGWEGIEDFLDPDRAGLGSLLRRRARRSSGARAVGEGAHRRRAGAGARPAPGRRPGDPGRARADARRGGDGQRPGAGLDRCPAAATARSTPWTGSWFYAVVARFLRALGAVRRGGTAPPATDSHADQPRGQADLLRREVTEMDNDILRRLIWTGLLAATGALASVLAHRAAARDLDAGLQGGSARVSMSSTARPPGAGPQRRPTTASVGELVLDVSERVSILIREEIELAKTEVREKVTKLVQGSVVGIAAGVFALHGAGDAHARHRLAAQRPVLRGRRLGRLHGRGRCSGSSSRRPPASSPTARCRPARRRRRTWRSRRPGAPRRRWRPARVERLAPTSTSAGPASRSAAPHRARPGAAPTRSGPTSSASARARPLGRGPARPRRRAHRLAPPGPRASARAGDRRRGRRLRDRRPDRLRRR